MSPRRALPRLYLITDPHAAATSVIEVVTCAARAAGAGGVMVQLRDKQLGGRALTELARALREVTRARDCPLVINDRLDVALAVEADGVHLPEAGMSIADARRLAGPDLLIGASTHGAEAARRACAAGANFVVCGPVWDTPSKRGMGDPIGLGELGDAARDLPGKVYALGGVTDVERAAAARDVGAHGVAVIRAVLTAADPGNATRALCRVFAQA